jgi:hypothetical protein
VVYLPDNGRDPELTAVLMKPRRKREINTMLEKGDREKTSCRRPDFGHSGGRRLGSGIESGVKQRPIGSTPASRLTPLREAPDQPSMRTRYRERGRSRSINLKSRVVPGLAQPAADVRHRYDNPVTMPAAQPNPQLACGARPLLLSRSGLDAATPCRRQGPYALRTVVDRRLNLVGDVPVGRDRLLQINTAPAHHAIARGVGAGFDQRCQLGYLLGDQPPCRPLGLRSISPSGPAALKRGTQSRSRCGPSRRSWPPRSDPALRRPPLSPATDAPGRHPSPPGLP